MLVHLPSPSRPTTSLKALVCHSLATCSGQQADQELCTAACRHLAHIFLSFRRERERQQGDSGISHCFITKCRKQVFAAMQGCDNQWSFEPPVWLRAFCITARSGRREEGRSSVLYFFEKWHLPGKCWLQYWEILWKQRLLFQVGTDHIDPGVQQVPDRYPQQLSGWTFIWTAPKILPCAYGVQFTQHMDEIKLWERTSTWDSWKRRTAVARILAGPKLCCLNKIFDCEMLCLCWVVENWNRIQDTPSYTSSSQTNGQCRSTPSIDTQISPIWSERK